jgi:hypothetical protein
MVFRSQYLNYSFSLSPDFKTETLSNMYIHTECKYKKNINLKFLTFLSKQFCLRKIKPLIPAEKRQ